MSKAATLKLSPIDFKQDATSALEPKLYTGEEVLWTGSPNTTWFLIDLAYKALIWWSIFAFIVPRAPGGGVSELTALMVLMLTWLEYKKQWNSRVYFITDTRVVYADKTRKGVWAFTDFLRSNFVSAKRTTVVKTLIMKFRTTDGDKTLKFPYLTESSEALRLLNTKVEDQMNAHSAPDSVFTG